MMNRAMQAGMMEALDSVIQSQPNAEALMKAAFAWWVDRWTGRVPISSDESSPDKSKETHWGAR